MKLLPLAYLFVGCFILVLFALLIAPWLPPVPEEGDDHGREIF